MNSDRLRALTLWAQTREQDPQLHLHLISGDASFRRYYRAQGKIWVDAPPQTEKNEEFVRNAAALLQAEIPAPEVYAVDLEQGFLCVSDLGDVSLLSRLDGASVCHWYGQAIEQLLPAIATMPLEVEPFDEVFMARENNIFPEWLLGHHLGLTLDAREQALLDETFAGLTQNNLAQPQVVMHRDFHSRNLMVLADERLAVIDFQDMVLGPLTYDLVSLLKDCYVRWPLPLVRELTAQGYRAYQRAGLLTNMSEAQFNRCLALTGMQRHLKAAGIFCRLHHRDGKSGYLKDIPRTLYYVLEVAQAEPQLHSFAEWLQRRVLPHFPYQPASEASTCV